MINQCHLALTMNEKEVDSERDMREHNELVGKDDKSVVKCDGKEKQTQHWGKACDKLLVKRRKLTDGHDVVIPVNAMFAG